VAARAARLSGGALAVALVLTGTGAVAARASGVAAAHAREAGARRAADASTRAFQAKVAAVRHTLDALTLLAPAIARSSAAPPVALSNVVTPGGIAGVTVVVLPAAGAPRLVAGTVPAGVALGTLTGSLGPALELARDTGDAHAGAVGHGIAVAVPVYAGSVVSTADRRSGLTAWVVGLVDPAALLADVTGPRETAVLRVGGVPVTDVAPRGRFAAESTTDLAGQPLQVVVTPHVEGGAGAIAWTVLAFALAGALGVLLVGRRSGTTLARSRAETEALEREARTVAELGPLLQQSLDLAEVLPAAAIMLSDEFGLDGFAVELLGEHGMLVDVFAIGRRRAEGAEPPLVVGVDGIPAGIEVALPLLRAGRTIGRLRMIARDALSPTQVDGLRGAADLIAVATYNVELYEREQATVRRLQEVDKLKDAFLGTISHELRTPITAIGGFVRLLSDRWDDLPDDQRRDFMRRVGRNSASLGMLVDDLLDFARLERQALSTNVSRTPLDTVVSTFVAQVVPALGEHPVETDLAPGVMALADPRAMERVLANLLTNAAKFSPPDSPIQVGLRAGDEVAILTVSDHGPGIAEEDRLRVFTRFYRGESEAARSTRGAGIGLAVVHELVTQMGGDIEVRPREPHGTTMLVRLPLAGTATDPTDSTDPTTAPPAQRPPADDRIPARSRP
jgi:signal transduction histidine kinase